MECTSINGTTSQSSVRSEERKEDALQISTQLKYAEEKLTKFLAEYCEADIWLKAWRLEHDRQGCFFLERNSLLLLFRRHRDCLENRSREAER